MMALDLKQELRLTQQLVITPQLQQAIKLLQLNRIELQEVIQEELSSNPLLEEEEESFGVGAKEAETEGEFEEYWEGLGVDSHWSPSPPRRSVFDEEDRRIEDFATRQITLQEYLLWQLRMAPLGPEELRIGEQIVGNIDDDGYLRASVEEIAASCGSSTEAVERVLEVIQSFDPPGVGARDLRECLLLQLSQKEEPNPMAEALLRDHFDALKRGDYQALAKGLGLQIEEVLEVIEQIKRLEPKPGRPFGPEAARVIVPDVIIYKTGNDFEVALNDDGLPKLRINRHYRRMLEEGGEGVPVEYLKEKMRAAQWLIKSLEQRQQTLYKVTKSIVKFQKEFLEKGIDYLRPLILRDVAEDVGMHESTISRVTTNKYAVTPQGLFELKFFFSGKVGEGAVEMSVRRVKKLIQEIIAEEDPRAPYSDQRIVEILKARYGLEIARRTVAKYREGLAIPSSKERRRTW